MLSDYAREHLGLCVRRCNDLERFCRERPLDGVLDDPDLVDSCIRKAEEASGAVYQIRDQRPDDYAAIAELEPDREFWSGVDRMRHRLAHDYLNVSASKIYDYVGEGLFSRLRSIAERSLSEL